MLNTNFTLANVGPLKDLLTFPNGKIFMKDNINATGAELSFQLLPAGTQLPFFHSHKQNEEIYVVISGRGKMQIDEVVFDLAEGSVVRVAPAGARSMKAATDLIYMVIQVRENSLTQWTGEDGQPENIVSKL
ncbi:cupin domain-containing protein [Lachnospiraceae bacterium OttesenSCG-928-E19]|nr:cupin domain-containing protein [Lachnospiraceae bacterium OttesenSCG-928-E19]